MNKRKLRWLLLAIIILIVAVGGGILIGKRMQSSTRSTVQQSASTKDSTSSSKKDSSKSKQAGSTKRQASSLVSRDSTNNLTADDIGPATMAMSIVYYAQQHVVQSGTNSWQSMYQSYLKNLGTIIISKANVNKMEKPGMGVAYYIVPRGGDVDTDHLSAYPSYTLENNKTIHIYQSGDYQKVAATVTLKKVVRNVNQSRQASKLTEISQNMSIVDHSHEITDDGDTNHITSKEAEDPQLLAKVIIYYGMHNDPNEYWQGLQKDIDNGVDFEIASGDQGGNVIGFMGNTTGCIVYNAPQNAASGRPDLYSFAHESSDGKSETDIPSSDEVGFTFEQMISYINTHGGRAVLEKIKVKAGSFFG